MGNTEPKTADLVSASVTADAAATNGAGDFAVFEAGKAELLLRCEVDCEMIRDERELLIRRAGQYDATKRPGYAASARKQAEAKNAEIKERREAYAASLALFAIKGGFASFMPADEMGSAAASAIRKQLRPVLTMLRNLIVANVETLDMGEGSVWNVRERFDALNSIGLTAEEIASIIGATETAPSDSDASQDATDSTDSDSSVTE